MKNIFSNFGTKKVAGAVLAGATLLVGLGVVNNFSGNSQKATNEAALARFSNSAYNNSVGNSSASRADLERRIAAGQDGYSARFLQGKASGVEADETFSSDGAYAEGVRGGDGSSFGSSGVYGVDGSAYTNGDAYQAFGSTYEQEFDGMKGGTSQGSTAYGERQFQAAQAAAAQAAGQQGKEGKNSGKGGAKSNGRKGIRQATQINKLGASSSGSSFGKGGASGGSGINGGSSSFGSGSIKGDSNTRSLPQANTQTGVGDSSAFKFGRAAGMGGFNVGFSGSESKGGTSKGRGAANDLYMAKMYSNKATVTQQAEGQKALAEAAFDGSNPEDLGPTIAEGASVGQVASELSRGLDIDVGDPNQNIDNGPSVEEIIQKKAELEALQKKLTWIKVGMILGALAFSVGIFFLRRIPVYGWVYAALATLAAAVFLVGMGLWMKDIVDQMADPKYKDVNQAINFVGQYSSIIKLGVSAGIIVGLGWTNKWNEIFQKVKEFFTKPTLVDSPVQMESPVELPSPIDYENMA